MKNKLILGIVCLVVLVACNSEDKQQENSDTSKAANINVDEVQLSAAQIESAGIAVGKVEMKEMHSNIQVNGVVDVPPENVFSVSVPMGGYLRRMTLIPGMMVKKGSTLAIVEDQQYIQLQQDYLTAKNRLKLVTADYTRQKGLNATKAISDKVFQQSENDYHNQSVLMKALAEKLRLIGINPATLTEDNISKSIRVPAPISGFVTKVNVNTGKYVNATDILFEIISPGALHANLTVFEKDAANLKSGQQIVCTTTANPGKQYFARIHLITPSIKGDRTTSVHCDIENADSKLLPGTFLNAAIATAGSLSESVPEDAIVKWENKNYVFEEVRPFHYKMVPVELAESSDGYTAITAKRQLGNIVIRNAYAILMKMKNGGEEGE